MHQAQRVSRWARLVPGFAHRALDAIAATLPVSHANFSPTFKVRSFLRGSASKPPINHALWMSSFSPAEQRMLLEPDTLEAAHGGEGSLRAFHDAWVESEGGPLLARAGHLDAVTYLPNDILMKVDRASMAVALEVRAPFLARDVVEYAFGLPDEYRMHGLTGKRILRDAVRDLLPPSVLERPKKGFGMPVARWLMGPLRTLAEDMLSESRLREAGFFRPEAVRHMLREHHASRADFRKPLWTLLVFELWRDHHPGGIRPDESPLPIHVTA
jgi:asparagine synthase (glutamine-hydrolysing)